MDALVKVLLEKETLDAAEFGAIVKRVDEGGSEPPPSSDETPTPPAAIVDEPGGSIELGSPEGRQEPPPSEFRPKFA